MKLVEACGQMINTEYITNIRYDYCPCGNSIEIIMLNGNKIHFPVSDRKEYEEIVKKLNPTKDVDVIDCAKRIKEYCTFGKCDNCVFHSNGRCFTQPEVEDNYYNEEPSPIYPIDWEV